MKSTSKIINVLHGLMFGLIVLFVSGQAFAQGGSWETKAPMPIATAGMEGGFIGGKLYLVGGGTNISHTYNVEVYDPVADTWGFMLPAPILYSGHAAAVIGDKLYLVGGCAGDCSTPTNILQAYDPGAETWTTLAPMPSSKGGIAAAAIDGKLYVVGGFVGWYSDVNWLDVYDPATNTWTRLADMPTARESLEAVAIDGKLYAVGGYVRSGPGLPGDTTGKLEVYDPGTNTWATLADMPTGRSNFAIGAFNGRLYAAGGATGLPSAVNTLEEYDPVTGNWVTRATMPTARWATGFGLLNGQLYVAGGAVDPYPTGVATMEVYTPPAGVANQPPVADAGPDQVVMLGETVPFDGSGSYDLDGTIVSYDWDFDDGIFGSGETTTHFYTSAGTYTVTLTVMDDDGATETDTAIVTVQTPAEATQDLISDVEDLNLPGGTENSLVSKLENAIKSLDKGQENAAINQLNAFINQVEAQKGKKITDEEADQLIAIAQWIIDNV